MNKLFTAVSDYIAMRRQLGYKMRNNAYVLRNFVAFLAQKNKSIIKTKLALEFATQRLKPSTSRWPAVIIGMIRRFAIYLHAIDGKSEIPPVHLLPDRYERRVPFIFSASDIIRLLEVIRALVSESWLANTFYTYFGLLAVTGMRPCEAITLADESIDFAEGILEIRQTKFRKSRKIPLHITTQEILKNYKKNRNKKFPAPKTQLFFVDSRGNKLNYIVLHKTFRKMCVAANLSAKNGLKPMIMGFRHSFVVRNLLRCYQEDLDVDQMIAALSTYLGHENPEYTYWYITSTPELLNLINLRTEKKYWRK